MSKNQFSYSLKLFHQAAKRVPAYSDFLKQHKIKPAKMIKSEKNWSQVPVSSKQSYLKKYKLAQLCWEGKLNGQFTFTATSGSTGPSTYFLRNESLDLQYSYLIEDFVKQSSFGYKNSILVIIGFGMGVWIGGLITYQGFLHAAKRNNFPLSIITPGVNKEEIIKALVALSPNYSQTIMVGYPPFIKDVIDEAVSRKVNLKKLRLRFLFAAESFSEKFRYYLKEKTSLRNVYRDTLNVYGSADIGAMAGETPISILARELATKHKDLFSDLFGNINKTPTLAQFNSEYINFESKEGELLLTGNSAIPLIRYALGDNGGVYAYGDLIKVFKKHNVNLESRALKLGLNHAYKKWPFVYVYERNDLSVSIYGINLYPEYIKEALLNRALEKYVTQRFTMMVRFDNRQNQYLEINIELKKNVNVSKSVKKAILKKIKEHLRNRSSEFKELSNYINDRELIKLVFWANGDPTYFLPGIKQRWIQK